MNSRTALATVVRNATKVARRFLYGKWIFLDPAYLAYTNARLQHLESLNLNLSKKNVLEVGSGIGLLTQFFERKGCNVLSTDGNIENVKEMQRRYHWRRIELLDLDRIADLSSLGMFDVVFCYGTFYHLSKPAQALKALSCVCQEMILLETRVALGNYPELHYVRELAGAEHAVSGVGCRPTRRWVMNKLREYFGYAYQTKTQPYDQDFPVDWSIPPEQVNYNAVFVGSKRLMTNPNLLADIPDHQYRA